MKISALLATKGASVVTIATGASSPKPSPCSADHNIGSLVVSRDGSVVEGIMSERDVVRGLEAVGPDVSVSPCRRS